MPEPVLSSGPADDCDTPRGAMPKISHSELGLASDGTGLRGPNAEKLRILRYGDPEAKQRKHMVVVITTGVGQKKMGGIAV